MLEPTEKTELLKKIDIAMSSSDLQTSFTNILELAASQANLCENNNDKLQDNLKLMVSKVIVLSNDIAINNLLELIKQICLVFENCEQAKIEINSVFNRMQIILNDLDELHVAAYIGLGTAFIGNNTLGKILGFNKTGNFEEYICSGYKKRTRKEMKEVKKKSDSSVHTSCNYYVVPASTEIDTYLKLYLQWRSRSVFNQGVAASLIFIGSVSNFTQTNSIQKLREYISAKIFDCLGSFSVSKSPAELQLLMRLQGLERACNQINFKIFMQTIQSLVNIGKQLKTAKYGFEKKIIYNLDIKTDDILDEQTISNATLYLISDAIFSVFHSTIIVNLIITADNTLCEITATENSYPRDYNTRGVFGSEDYIAKFSKLFLTKKPFSQFNVIDVKERGIIFNSKIINTNSLYPNIISVRQLKSSSLEQCFTDMIQGDDVFRTIVTKISVLLESVNIEHEDDTDSFTGGETDGL